MLKIKKALLIIPMLVFFLPVIPCQAKVEETTEVELVDMGHGIMVPSDFNVKNEDGVFVTLSGLDANDWQIATIDEDFYSITLDNGYRAEKTWLYTDRSANEGYRQITVFNENNEAVFFLGRSGKGADLVFVMEDKNGNQVKNTYSRSSFGDTYSTSNDDGSLRPLERIVHDVDADTRKKYMLSDDVMKLSQKYEYGQGGDGVCTVYNLCRGEKDYDREDEYYEEYSYKEKDLKEYSFCGPIYDGLTGDEVYGENVSRQPSVITKRGKELYLYKVAGRNDNWVRPAEKELMEGKDIEFVCYFTKEQVEVLEAEKLKYYDEIEDKYPEFLHENDPEPEVDIEEEQETEEENTPVQESPAQEEDAPEQENPAPEEDAPAQESPTPEENVASQDSTSTEGDIPEGYAPYLDADDGTYYNTQGGTFFQQRLTGDVYPINGKTPTILLTYIQDTPVGKQISLQLVDENYNNLAVGSAFDIEHTKYKYAYLTLFENADSFVFFQVAGSDTPISGNLNYGGQTEYMTENGTENAELYVGE